MRLHEAGKVSSDGGEPAVAPRDGGAAKGHDNLDGVRPAAEQAVLEAELTALAARSAEGSFGLVAVAPKTHIRLWVGGSLVLAWGKGLQASADGDAPLARDEFLNGLNYDADKQYLLMAGSFPNLIALRINDAPCATMEFAVNAFARKNGRWTARAIGNRGNVEGSPPFAFVSWSNGGLMVDSIGSNCGAYTSGGPIGELPDDERGTKLTLLGANGKYSHPTLGVDRMFIVWGASSSGDTLSLVGSYAAPKGHGEDAMLPAAVVMRRHGAHPFRASEIGPKTVLGTISSLQRVREFGKAALFLPSPARDDGTSPFGYPEMGDEMNSKDNAKSLFIVTNRDTKEVRWRTPALQDCYLPDAVLDREGVLAILECPMPPPTLKVDDENYAIRMRRLLRIRLDGSKELIELPKLAHQGELVCEPQRLELRPPDDIWVSATCGNGDSPVAALFRRDHPQTPLVVQ